MLAAGKFPPNWSPLCSLTVAGNQRSGWVVDDTVYSSMKLIRHLRRHAEDTRHGELGLGFGGVRLELCAGSPRTVGGAI